MGMSAATAPASVPERRPAAVFVDDEPLVLQALQRMLRPLRDTWQMHFVSSGAEALELLSRQPCDVVISDMRMPGMSGAELLEQVRRRHPHTVRIALSGQASPETIANDVAPVHQFLSKPCDPELLRRTLARARTLGCLLAVERLRGLAGELQALPSRGSAYAQLLSALRSSEPSVKRVAEAISADLGMSAKVLQLVNSAFFGLPRRVSSPAEAVMLLGLETVKALAVTAGVFALYDQSLDHSVLSLSAVRDHGSVVGTYARLIARHEGLDRVAGDAAFVAGLLHDVGRLVLAAKMPDEYRGVTRHVVTARVTVADAEMALIGATHAEVGAYLLGLWGFSDPVVTTVAHHHRPAAGGDTRLGPLTLVHVADRLEHERWGAKSLATAPALDLEYLQSTGAADRLPVWREICHSTVVGEGCP